MDVAGLEALAAIPVPDLLAFTPERTVVFGHAVEVAFDRVHEAPGISLHQKARSHICTVGLCQATIGQPLNDFAVARSLAQHTLGGC